MEQEPSMKSKKTLIIDCQVFQSAALHRGMGKYSWALLEKVLEDTRLKDRTVHLLFNEALPLDDALNAKIEEHSVASGAQIIKVKLAVPKEPRTEHNVQTVRLKNKKILTEHVTENYSERPDFLILSLYLDEVCSVFPDYADVKSLVYYDSIPYLYNERYGQFKGFFEHFYLPHTATVYEADKILTISNTVANDLHIFFGIPKTKLCNIDGAPIKKKSGESVRPNLEGLKEEFILLNSGQEIRKNNYRAAQAFQNFLTRTNKDISLVITSHFTQEAQDELREICPNILFSGNVAIEELDWLYAHCSFLLSPTEYEGLGLFILEAMEEMKPIICSDIPVFKEISADAFYVFNPLDESSITEALISATATGVDHSGKLAKYDAIRKKYTWERSATVLLDKILEPRSSAAIKKKKIAILCPDPRGFSAIGKVIVESHAEYAEHFDIDYYFDRGPFHRYVRPNLLEYVTPCHEAKDFTEKEYAQYDAVIYHIGNSEYHLQTIRAALYLPGYIILHDTHLGGAFKNLLTQKVISKARYDLEEVLNKQIAKDGTSTFLTSVVNNQKAVVTHSQYAQSAVSKLLTKNKVKVEQINLPVDTPFAPELFKSKSKQGYTIALAGIIASVKGLAIIEQIANDPELSHCTISIFGFSFAEPDEVAWLKTLPHVRVVTNPSDFRFQTELADADILVNVRKEYRGETSLTTLEHMRYGRTVLVKKMGWYDELPNGSVVKVKSQEDVIPAIKELIEKPSKIKNISEKSLSLMDQEFTHAQYAQKMRQLIDSK